MSCSCESRLDSIIKFLEEMRADIGVVKTKCDRIEKEILGITLSESEMNPEALMETLTVRHLLEKLTFDMRKLTEESNNKARAETKRQQKIETTRRDLQNKFLEAADEKIKDLKLKYDSVGPKAFETEFAKLREDLRSETEKTLLKKGFAGSIIHDTVEDALVRATDSDDLYNTHFLKKYKEMKSSIRDQYGQVFLFYSKKVSEGVGNAPEVKLVIISEFLEKFKLCEESFAFFRKELLIEFQRIYEQIEARQQISAQSSRNLNKISFSLFGNN